MIFIVHIIDVEMNYIRFTVPKCQIKFFLSVTYMQNIWIGLCGKF